MKIKTNCYGVLLGLTNRHPFIATDGKGAPAIFDRAKRARDYRDELAEHALKGKVVKVHVTCDLPPNDPKLSDGGAWRGSCEGGAQKEGTDV